MCDGEQNSRNGVENRCAVCQGRFGLIRYYSWRSALCSKKCRDRFQARREGDNRWIHRFRAA